MVQKNHLTGLKRIYLRVNFMTVQSLLAVRDELLPMIKKNRERQGLADVYSSSVNATAEETTDFTGNKMKKRDTSRAFLDSIVDIREYDVPYYMRVSIDKGE